MPPSLERLGGDRPPAPPIVGLVGDSFDWHARQLAQAFATRGIATAPIRLPLCSFCTRSGSGLLIDGFGEKLPDAVVVRTMSGGTFEAVTLRLGILHALRDLGVIVWNDARAIERCVDKSMTSFLLTRAGIPTPVTWVTESFEQARSIVQSEAGSHGLVLKPLFGSQGRGLKLVRTPDDLPREENKTGVYYLQRFVGVERRGGYHDFRLLVVRGRVIAAMQRHSSHWITNIKRGGRSVAVAVNEEMKALAVRATAAVAADFAGVDIVYTATQQPTVLEVNSMPAWSGLQKVTSANIAGLFADALKTALAARVSRGATA
ncbi:MAG: RimK family alpha-L-glutamate ligase [Bradyrhizobiaceae bacterium]|nr:RimK family alpha-L-glutamate ligase [Bradyrhizobiaceae bacterium]